MTLGVQTLRLLAPVARQQAGGVALRQALGQKLEPGREVPIAADDAPTETENAHLAITGDRKFTGRDGKRVGTSDTPHTTVDIDGSENSLSAVRGKAVTVNLKAGSKKNTLRIHSDGKTQLNFPPGAEPRVTRMVDDHGQRYGYSVVDKDGNRIYIYSTGAPPQLTVGGKPATNDNPPPEDINLAITKDKQFTRLKLGKLGTDDTPKTTLDVGGSSNHIPHIRSKEIAINFKPGSKDNYFAVKGNPQLKLAFPEGAKVKVFNLVTSEDKPVAYGYIIEDDQGNVIFQSPGRKLPQITVGGKPIDVKVEGDSSRASK